MKYNRLILIDILGRLQEPRRFIQVLTGPRQVGKTTLIKQAINDLKLPTHYASADEPGINNTLWLAQQWELARKLTLPKKSVLLVLDEVQKIDDWSSQIKKLWDEDSFNELNLKVVLLGSSPLLMQKGLTESLAGRFENIPITHWSFPEMQKAFNWNLDQYIYFGGYPGSASLINDEERWRAYINDSLIETSISRDILLMTRVDKPALLRQLFHLACDYSGQILSYQKMLGQLQDAGNTTTLAHYLQLLSQAGMVTGLQKFSGKQIIKRNSSPKLQVLNNALLSSQTHSSFDTIKNNHQQWGRWVESAAGAYLTNECRLHNYDIHYWREGQYETDFVLVKDNEYIGIEIKSGWHQTEHSGLERLSSHFPIKKTWIIGEKGLSLKDFFSNSIDQLF